MLPSHRRPAHAAGAAATAAAAAAAPQAGRGAAAAAAAAAAARAANTRSSRCRCRASDQQQQQPQQLALNAAVPLPPAAASVVVPPAPRPPPSPCGRRAALGAGAASLALASGAEPSWALRTVQLRDGAAAEVYEHGMTLSIVALRGSVPEQWIPEFRQGLGKYAGFELGQRGQLAELFAELADPEAKRSAGAADVATLGDAWLGPAVRRGLVQPLASAESYRWWRRLPRRWQRLVRRAAATGAPPSAAGSSTGDAAAAGAAGAAVWGCPYRWGAVLVASKREQLLKRGRAPVRCWADLLQPALKGRVALPDSPREVLGVAFKTLGLPGVGFNATERDLAAAGVSRDDARARVRALRSQARLFSSQEHVRALLAGDVWAVVGSSTDLVPLGERTPSVELVAPCDGTGLWADVWAVPAGARHGHLQSGPSPILPSWLEFCTSPARADVLNGLKTGASPSLLPPAPEDIAAAAIAAVAAAEATAARGDGAASGGGRSWRFWRRGGGGGPPHSSPSSSSSPLSDKQRDAAEAAAERRGAEHRRAAAAAARALRAEAAALPQEELQLTQAGAFMPPDAVLSLSEFTLPVDDATLEFYAWLLAP